MLYFFNLKYSTIGSMIYMYTLSLINFNLQKQNIYTRDSSLVFGRLFKGLLKAAVTSFDYLYLQSPKYLLIYITNVRNYFALVKWLVFNVHRLARNIL